MRYRLAGYMMTICVLASCGGSRSQWDDIDYTPVYRAYEGRQNDAGYTAPSILSCVQEDRHECN
ncbi:MAG: hypothetical protein ACN2B6_03215 [Rickettsiales bacterium]